MSASQYRSQLDRKRKQRIEADKKAGEYRSKESSKRANAAKAQQAAARTTSSSTRSSKLREADRREKEAETVGREASRWQRRAAGYAKEEAACRSSLPGLSSRRTRPVGIKDQAPEQLLMGQ